MVSKKQVKVLVKTVVLFVFFVLAGCFFSCDNEKENQIIIKNVGPYDPESNHYR